MLKCHGLSAGICRLKNVQCAEKSEYSWCARGRRAARKSILQIDAILQILQYSNTAKMGKNKKKHSFEAKFRKYCVSTIKFFSSNLVKTSQ